MDYESMNRIRNIIRGNTPSYIEDRLFPQDQVMSDKEYKQQRVYAKEPGFMGKLGAYSAGVSGEEYGNIYGEKEGALFGLGSSAADGLHALGGAKVNRSMSTGRKPSSITPPRDTGDIHNRLQKNLGVDADGMSFLTNLRATRNTMARQRQTEQEFNNGISNKANRSELSRLVRNVKLVSGYHNTAVDKVLKFPGELRNPPAVREPSQSKNPIPGWLSLEKQEQWIRNNTQNQTNNLFGE